MRFVRQTVAVIMFTVGLLTGSRGFCATGTEGTLTLATGSENGVYYRVGRGIASAASKADIKLDVVSSAGSRENLLWLSQNKAQLGIVQSDTVYNAYRGLGEFTDKIANIRVIGSLYTEAVHILVRNPLYIRKIESFKGKRISIGPVGSGTEANARAILEAAGITINEVELSHLTFDESIKALNERTVDIAFFTSGYPSEAVKTVMQAGVANFFELDPEVLDRLIEVCPFFVVTNIPPNVYPHQDEDITTIGVRALLISRDDLDEHRSYTLTRLVFTAREDRGFEIDVKDALKGVTSPVSDGARRFFEESGLYRKQHYAIILTNYALPAFLILLAVIGFFNRKRIIFFFSTGEIVRVFCALGLVWFCGSIVLYYAEHRINENYSNLTHALWSGLINWISFGSKEPFTSLGRATSIVMTVLGLGGIAWLTGEIASIFVRRSLMGGKHMVSNEKHYVIINWNSKGAGIIKQLRSPDLPRSPIVVVTRLKDSPVPPEFDSHDIQHISDKSVTESLLRRASVHRARSVLVLADDTEPSPHTADSDTVLTILAVKKLCEEAGNPVAIVAEILEPEAVDLARFVGGFGDGRVEIVSPKYIAQNMIAQVVVTPGLTKIYEDLLTFDRQSNEIYSCPVPARFVGQSFACLMKAICELRANNANVIPIAISRSGRVYVNPTTAALPTMEAGDVLFAICDSASDLKRMA